MSKKKAFTGTTMTLKDFHGGSIPSDLPLPSAPGVTARPADRTNYERQSAWGGVGGLGRGEYRGRPSSSSSVRAFDDKTPFLASSVNIGRNFDEDERKPIDGSSGPRRTVSDEILHPSIVRLEEKPSSVLSGRVSGKPGLGLGLGLAPGVPVGGGSASSYLSRVADRSQAEVTHLSVGGQSGGGQTNVWAARKEAAFVAEASPLVWSEEVAASKLAHATALDKVSSGRWQTKLLVPQQTEVEVVQHLQTENGVSSYANVGVRTVEEEKLQDSVLAKHAERSVSISESGHSRPKELLSSVQENVSTRKTSVGNNAINNDMVPQPSKLSSGHVSSEPSERPRLNLLPRSKPLEKTQPPAGEYKQENSLPIKPGSAGSEIENRAEERPKLFIRPPSQPPQQLQVTTEKERNALFGGARPRELVLKERGVDTGPADLIQSPNRMRNEILKSEAPHVNAPIRQDRAENQSLDQWNGRKIERKDNKVDSDRTVNRQNWRSDGRKINVETDKQQNERQPSPETWRKPESSSTGVRNGKAASALELAQAFSRSTSDPKASERLRTLPNASNRNSVPFSRLTVPDSRPHIHGH